MLNLAVVMGTIPIFHKILLTLLQYYGINDSKYH